MIPESVMVAMTGFIPARHMVPHKINQRNKPLAMAARQQIFELLHP